MNTSGDSPTVQLTNFEAVPLATALVNDRAREADIRAVVIKGLVVEHHGLRPARAYADVDVMVEPARFRDFVSSLELAGWHPRTHLWVFDRLDVHSVTLIHDNWPCDIDVHAHFPGFLAPAPLVFDELWRRRIRIDAANSSVTATDDASSAAILALHALRKPDVARNTTELAYLIETLRVRPDLARDLSVFAARTGSSETLRPVLERIGAPILRGVRAPRRDLRAWRRRTAVGSRAGQWITYMMNVRWYRWPREIIVVAWPPRALYLQEHPDVDPNSRSLFVERSKRIVRGLGDLARVVVDRRS